MANFGLTYTPVNVDVTGNAWIDPITTLPNPHYYVGAPPGSIGASPSMLIPSRQNAQAGLPHRYVRFLLGQEVRAFLTPDGGGPVAPPDTALGGKLFQAWFAEVPTATAHTWNAVPGQSATQWFNATVRGAFCAVFSRAGGGAIISHFMVE